MPIAFKVPFRLNLNADPEQFVISFLLCSLRSQRSSHVPVKNYYYWLIRTRAAAAAAAAAADEKNEEDQGIHLLDPVHPVLSRNHYDTRAEVEYSP